MCVCFWGCVILLVLVCVVYIEVTSTYWPESEMASSYELSDLNVQKEIWVLCKNSIYPFLHSQAHCFYRIQKISEWIIDSNHCSDTFINLELFSCTVSNDYIKVIVKGICIPISCFSLQEMQLFHWSSVAWHQWRCESKQMLYTCAEERTKNEA